MLKLSTKVIKFFRRGEISNACPEAIFDFNYENPPSPRNAEIIAGNSSENNFPVPGPQPGRDNFRRIPPGDTCKLHFTEQRNAIRAAAGKSRFQTTQLAVWFWGKVFAPLADVCLYCDDGFAPFKTI